MSRERRAGARPSSCVVRDEPVGPVAAVAAFDPSSWEGPRVRLEDWTEFGDGLLGVATGHPSVPDGHRAWTSRVLWMDRERGLALTRNTLYELGARATGWAPESVVVNVRDFGAKGDGVADDTPAIQRALDVAAGLARR